MDFVSMPGFFFKLRCFFIVSLEVLGLQIWKLGQIMSELFFSDDDDDHIIFFILIHQEV